MVFGAITDEDRRVNSAEECVPCPRSSASWRVGNQHCISHVVLNRYVVTVRTSLNRPERLEDERTQENCLRTSRYCVVVELDSGTLPILRWRGAAHCLMEFTFVAPQRNDWGFRYGVQLEVPGSLRRCPVQLRNDVLVFGRSQSSPNVPAVCWVGSSRCFCGGLLLRRLLGLPGPFPGLRVRTLSGAMRRTPPYTLGTSSWSLPRGNGFALPQFGALAIIGSLKDCGEPAEMLPTT